GGEGVADGSPGHAVAAEGLAAAEDVGKVGESDDADEAALGVDDGHAANLVLLHQSLHGGWRVVRPAAFDVASHRAAHTGVAQRDALQVTRHADIAVGDDTDDAALRIDDGHRPAVDLPHDLSGGAEALFGRTAADVSGHDVFDLHLRLSFRPAPTL